MDSFLGKEMEWFYYFRWHLVQLLPSTSVLCFSFFL